MEDMKKKALEMANETANYWMQSVSVIGIEDVGNPDWIYAVVKYPDKKVELSVTALARKGSSCKSCGFGSLKYFAMILAYEKSRISKSHRIHYKSNGYPVHPVWMNLTMEELEKWYNIYDSVIGKYGFTRDSIDKANY